MPEAVRKFEGIVEEKLLRVISRYSVEVEAYMASEEDLA